MPVLTTIDSVYGQFSQQDTTGGLTVSTATTLSKSQSNVGFAPYKVHSVTTLPTGSTIVGGDAGVLTLSGTAVSQVVMPLASACPGAMFVFKTASAFAHVLTGSQETAGTKVFTDGTNQGSKLALAAVVGSSVALISNGSNFLVLGNSGSVTLSGT